MALIDTNILVRTEDLNSPDCHVCTEALRLLTDNDQAFISAQVLIEFWSVATRPLIANGLGFDPARADMAVGMLVNALRVLPEPPDMAERWRALASAVGVVGRQVHDTRLVALMQAHGVTDIVTLNGDDFRRYTGINVVHPNDVRDLVGG